MASNWFFFYQRDGKESKWELALAHERERIVADVRPAFATVLDLSSVPDDNDWSRVRYRGPFYADFDAGDDLPLVCEQFTVFLAKLDTEVGFDLNQARLYASGSKGFHIEIPQECFLPKVPATGVPWLPYVYRAMAESLMVDTLDLQVYTGKRGRMWRTSNRQRENGCFKVPLTLDEAVTITPDAYRGIIKAPRVVPTPTPPFCNSAFALLFERSRDKVTTQMRGKKKRQESANALLDPWKKAKKHPPTIEMIMRGENIAAGVGFQSIAMQLAIYATSVGMPLPEFLDRCRGLCENHVSDSSRYNTLAKRRDELSRMWSYMEENSLYEFDTAPFTRMVRPGVPLNDLGVIDTEDHGDTPAATPASSTTDVADGDVPVVAETVVEDLHRGVRRGFFMNGDGMWRRNGDNVDSVCRAVLRNVESFYDIERNEFRGYEFDIVVDSRKARRVMLGTDAFTSAAKMRNFFVQQQLSYQGGEPETAALLDIMSEKAARNGHVYVYPREGFFILNHPERDQAEPVKVYLTRDMYLSSIPPDDPLYFRLRYRPEQATSAYKIDVHRAPEIMPEHIPALRDLFIFNKPEVVADLVGWFVACHYRSAYLYLFQQFPLLQVYGEAGSGKTQTILRLARLHWYMTDVGVKSATAFTPFALDSHASASTSAPLLLDEYKPRELRMHRGKYEKVKDVLKASYVGGDIGERGTLNRGAESPLSLIKSKCTAPIVFMGEAIEMETAIIERCVSVNLSKAFQTRARAEAFDRLIEQPARTALAAIGRAVVEMGFALDLTAMRSQMMQIQAGIESKLPDMDDDVKRRLAPRLIYNRAVVVHGLHILREVLRRALGTEFDATIDDLLGVRVEAPRGDDARVVEMHGMSEVSKVMSRIALLSRDIDLPHEMRLNKDYSVGDGWVEMKVERAYDQYRRYCASINDTPLFDTLDSFSHALNAYSPVVDRFCASSALRRDDSSERVIRLDLRRLAKEGVQSFRQ